MIQAKVIADSKNEFGDRITTMVVTFPRIILAELNTHRMFSRNSASSRAIPFDKMVEVIKTNPFVPIAWMKDHSGMQGTQYITDEGAINFRKGQWLYARDKAVEAATWLSTPLTYDDKARDGKAGQMLPDGEDVTKQFCNRLLEPFMWHTAIITATEWENFFALRCPTYEVPCTNCESSPAKFRSRKDAIKDFPALETFDEMEWFRLNKGQAEIHMMALAESMWDALNESTPRELEGGEWHIPFGDDIYLPPTIPIPEGLTLEEGVQLRKVMVATARCARVSYTTVGDGDKITNYENDIKLHDRLAASGHWSPFEHCARAMRHKSADLDDHTEWSGNFRGFVQYRKMFANENIK
jgi:hypothetical protein